jgi:uncharacterized protein YoxC
MPATPKSPSPATNLLQSILARHIEIGLSDHQLLRVTKLYWGDSTPADAEATLAVVIDTLSAEQLGKLLVDLTTSVGSASDQPDLAERAEALVAAAVEKQTKDKQFLEVEVAAGIAERVMGWAKIFGFFVAAPIALLLLILGIFGISKFEDVRQAAKELDTKVQEAHTKVDAAVRSAEDVSARASQLLDATNTKLASVTNAVAAQGAQISDLGKKVDNLAERLSFDKASDISADVQAKLRDAAGRFLKFFQSLGYVPKSPLVNVTTTDQVANTLSYYDPQRNAIVLRAELAEDDFVVLREYSHRILYGSLHFDALGNNQKSWNMSLTVIEYGLANYFPATFLQRPTLGVLAAQRLGPELHLTKPFLFDLDNKAKITKLIVTDVSDISDLEEAWGGTFWAIRQQLTPAIADKLLFQAWILSPDDGNATIGRAFITNVLSQARLLAGDRGADTVRQILLDCGINQSDLPAMPGSP